MNLLLRIYKIKYNFIYKIEKIEKLIETLFNRYYIISIACVLSKC